jgi:outer membrane protein TolC
MGIEPTGIETVGGSINPELIEVSLDTLIKKAIENRPEISGKRLELAYYRDEYKSAYTNYLPKINLTSNYGYLGTKFPGERGVWDENDQWNIGINLNFDLFTGFGRHERIKSALSNTYIKEQELKETRLNVILDVKEAWLTLVNAQEELKLTKKNLELARENYKYVNESYKLGAGTILELIDAEESLRKANYKRTDALYNWKLAKIRLKRATGKSLL